jgi:hypothetical protein
MVRDIAIRVLVVLQVVFEIPMAMWCTMVPYHWYLVLVPWYVYHGTNKTHRLEIQALRYVLAS